MAYYSYPYQPNYFSNYPAQQQTQQSNGVNWVQGEAGARSWLTAPNSTVLLMDSEAEKFYLKTTDASGMPQPLRVFEYREVTQSGRNAGFHPSVDNSTTYVTKAEFDAFKAELEAKHEPAV